MIPRCLAGGSKMLLRYLCGLCQAPALSGLRELSAGRRDEACCLLLPVAFCPHVRDIALASHSASVLHVGWLTGAGAACPDPLAVCMSLPSPAGERIGKACHPHGYRLVVQVLAYLLSRPGTRLRGGDARVCRKMRSGECDVSPSVMRVCSCGRVCKCVFHFVHTPYVLNLYVLTLPFPV